MASVVDDEDADILPRCMFPVLSNTIQQAFLFNIFWNKINFLSDLRFKTLLFELKLHEELNSLEIFIFQFHLIYLIFQPCLIINRLVCIVSIGNVAEHFVLLYKMCAVWCLALPSLALSHRMSLSVSVYPVFSLYNPSLVHKLFP